MSSADQPGPIGTSEGWLRTGPQRYGFALLVTALATALRFALELTVGPFPPLVMFIPAIVLAAVLGGFGAGILTTFLSSTSVALFFWDSLKTFGPNPWRESVGLLLFFTLGAGISGMAALYRRHAARLGEFQRVVEGLDEMIAVVDRDYRYLIANRAFLQYRGMKSEDVIGRQIVEVLGPAVFDETIRPNLEKCFQGQVVQYEMQFEYPERGKRDLLITYFPFAGLRGVDRVACILQDITRVKDADRSLRLFRTLIDQSNDAVEVIDLETMRVLDINDRACVDLGYSRDEMLRMTVYDFDPRLTEEIRAPVVTKLREGECLLKESIHKRKDGTTFPVETSLKTVKLDRQYLIAVSRDISRRRNAEAALRESEDRYRDLVEHSEDLVCTHDLEGNLISVNPAPARCLGYEVGELLKIPMRQLVAPEFREAFDRYLERIKTKGADQGLLCVVVRNGERRIWEYQNTLRTEGVPEPVVRGMARDVTERLRAEAALRASEERYRTLFEKSVAGVAISNMEGKVLDCNEAWARMLGYDSPAEIRGRHASEFYFDGTERESVRPELLQDGAVSSREIQLRRKDGASVWILYSSVVRPETRGGPPVLQATAVDITGRKAAEEALRRREQEYRQFVEQSSEGIFREDLDAPLPIDLPEQELIQHILHDSYLAECNDALAKMYGCESSRELVGKRMTEMVVADNPRNIELTREYIRSGFRLLERESHEVDAHGNPKVFRNSMIGIVENGNLVRTWGIQRDVTEQVKAAEAREKAERALQASEAHFRELVEQASDGIATASSDGRWIDVNSAWAAMVGSTRDEALQQVIGANLVPEDVPLLAPELERLRRGEISRAEWRIRRKDGSVLPCEITAKQLPSGQIQVISRDISQRKWADQALRTSQRELSELAKQLETERARLIEAQAVAKVGSWEVEFPSLQITWSEQTHRIFETDALHFHPKRPDFVEFVHPEDRAKMDAAFAASLENRAPATVEYRIILADGRVKVLEEHWNVFYDEQGQPLRLVGTCHDITERKRAEEALRTSEERFRVALKDSPITVFNQDVDLRYTWIYNPQLYWQHEVLGKTDEEVLGPKKAASLTSLKRRVLKTGLPLREEIAVANNGKSFAFDMSIEPLFGANGAVMGITGTCMDIARLREMADGLQDARDRLAEEKSYLESEIQSELGFETIIGHTPALREVLAKARIVAPTDSTVLLLGETGTGKELVARSVHALSSRSSKTFVKLNCAAVPSGLLESELFGHEKGAFTGAVSQKVGRIELADKGTIFLDEIGELPLELQPKLLRVLQDREFERLGGVHTLRVDVRIIAATNRDLRQDIADKKFREDLYYRLNIFPIELPPLRERREDIPMLVQHFMRKHARRMGKHIDTIPPESMEILGNWSWPGNIRELENMIERMVILSKGHVLAPPPAELDAMPELVEDSLTEVEREHIIRILRETNGVLAGSDGAASRLGIKRTTLQSMLKRFGIEAQEYRQSTGTFAKS